MQTYLQCDNKLILRSSYSLHVLLIYVVIVIQYFVALYMVKIKFIIQEELYIYILFNNCSPLCQLNKENNRVSSNIIQNLYGQLIVRAHFQNLVHRQDKIKRGRKRFRVCRKKIGSGGIVETSEFLCLKLTIVLFMGFRLWKNRQVINY